LTTEFPFMDWFAAPCDRVMAAMREEWDTRLKPEKRDRAYEFFGKTTVTGIDVHDGAVRLRVTPQRAALRGQSYDYVFVTTGFGEEETAPGHEVVSYWTEDQIDEWRKSQRNVYVSGCGDGGLIDALRLVHGRFDGGWLAIRLAHLLSDWPMREALIDAESDALMAAKSMECMKLAAAGTEDEADPLRKMGARFENPEIARRLTDFYRKRAIPNLPAAANALLNRSLEEAKVAFGKVTLVSRQEQPFGPHSAPIHKIMVEHAMKAGLITYKRGELCVRDDGRKVINMLEGDDPVEINDDIGLVVRHGSPANLKGLASRAESGSLRIRQFMLADYIDTDMKTRKVLPPPKDYPRRDNSQERARYIGIRWAMARELIGTLFPDATVSATSDNFICLRGVGARTNPVPGDLPVPKTLFGIRLEEGVLPAVAAL
jgi:hypothetical protein